MFLGWLQVRVIHFLWDTSLFKSPYDSVKMTIYFDIIG